MLPIKFFAPKKSAPHPLGDNLARAMMGTVYVPPEFHDGEPLGRTNLHYGILHGGTEHQERCKREDKLYVHVDHGFWGRTNDLGAKKGWFRFQLLSQASWMMRPPIPADHERLKAIKDRKLVDLQPRRKTGTRIFYQPPSPFMREHWKLGPDFDGDALAHLRKQYPGLPVTVYEKGGNLAKALADCRLFVSFNSTAGYRALELGIDAVMTSPMTLWPYESMDLSDQDFADRREVMFAYMAGRCFEWGELEDGTAIFHMGRNGEIP